MAQGYDTDQGFPRLGARTDTWALFGQTMGLVAVTTGLFARAGQQGACVGRRPAHRASTKASTNPTQEPRRRRMSARPLPMPINPALLRHAEERRRSLENRIADQITRFAGSMQFVYLHIIWFAAWILLGVEHYPYGLLTMIVSLEAIFLSTFVMISQNRADEKRQVLADHQWQTVQEEEHQNEQLLQLSNQILELTRAIHAMNSARSPTGLNGTEQAASSSIGDAVGQ
jgi:uncharacterized membrane protein